MDKLFRITTEGAGEESRPDPARLVAGDPVFTTWNVEEAEGLYAGTWRSTPGRWRVVYTEWEYCRIVSGRSVIHGPAGAMEVGPGDGFVLRPGFEGEWEVVETTVKEYVVRV